MGKAFSLRWRLIMLLGFTFIQMNEADAQRKVKVAMAQIFSLDGDRSGNLVRIENALREAKAQKADIVTFPESCILGWINASAHERAYAIPGEDSEKLSQLARKYGVHLCVGLDEKEGDKLFGAALLIDDNGKILFKHRKLNVLPELMSPPYSVGNGVQAVDTKFGKIGMMICADSFLEEAIAAMRDKKPELLLIPYGWAADESEWPQHGKELEAVVQNAARKVGCPVIGTDLVGEVSSGPWRGKVYGGQSVAVDKRGKVLASGKDRDSDLVFVNVITGR
jgi:predicted amidohydrolase